MKITVEIRQDSWKWAKESALVTVHKKMKNLPDHEWKMAMLKAEHSPIRKVEFRILIEGIPRSTADQLARHKIGFEPAMGTWRTDRGNKPREEQRMSDLTDLEIVCNAQALINVSKDRLCIGYVEEETRKCWAMVIHEIGKVDPETAFYCVPSCVYRMGCKEQKSCGMIQNVSKMLVYGKTDIDIRYELYNNWFRQGGKIEGIAYNHDDNPVEKDNRTAGGIE